jgi:hypothetical protein
MDHGHAERALRSNPVSVGCNSLLRSLTTKGNLLKVRRSGKRIFGHFVHQPLGECSQIRSDRLATRA